MESNVQLQTEIESLKETSTNASRFVDLAKKFTEIRELTYDVLHTFAKRINISEKQRVEGTKKFSHIYTQEVKIYFTHIVIVNEY